MLHKIIPMEFYTILLLLLPFTIFLAFFLSKHTRSKLSWPPGPKSWPIIGNILQLGDKPHRAIAELSKIYGPIMSLKLGSNRVIVISSSKVAKEMFTKHDLVLSSRSIPDIGRVLNHDTFSMVWLPVCPKWRNLRKIVTIQLFTSQRLDDSQVIRQKKVNELVEYVQQRCEDSLPVDIGKAGNTTSLNLLSNTFFSIDLASHSGSKSQEFRDLTRNIVEDAARPNVSDLFPIVRRWDIQGVLKKHAVYFRKLMRIFEKIIDERLKDSMDVKDDVLGTLLKLVENNELSLDEVKHMLVDLFIAGTDTTSITLEWAMTELLRNPTKMEKAKSELDDVLGKKGSMQESYISNLPYIQAVLKETLRLHPPVPLLIPHKAIKEVQLCDYLVPKNSTLWVNVWWISHDPSVWPNPECFSPERFLEKEIDAKGQDFEFIPFGAGRRMCPGIPLAYRMLHLMLATLIHSFNWKYGNGEHPEDLDMKEKFGMTLQKAHPLEAIPFLK
ncbi:cytochrome P450 76AD1-like [Chenopodium quinoa]|uniref:Cytochrome P450 n=1 Tax=Chenopodium quinoa TaxID=63459 RepID=A0A803N9V8_CHEQI|nr:cytochrome P450 76AD1-like [Chenopodium quinoa]